MNQISKVWEFLLTLGAGTGPRLHPPLVLVARERLVGGRGDDVGARLDVAPFLLGGHPLLDPATPRGFAMTLILTTAVTTAVWLAATFLTSRSRGRSCRLLREGAAGGAGLGSDRGGDGRAAGEGQFAATPGSGSSA